MSSVATREVVPAGPKIAFLGAHASANGHDLTNYPNRGWLQHKSGHASAPDKRNIRFSKPGYADF